MTTQTNARQQADEYIVPDNFGLDWRSHEFVAIRKHSGWRVYAREFVQTYNGSNWGQGGSVHYRVRALRDADTGKPWPFQPTAEQAVKAIRDALADDPERLLPI